MIGGLIGRLVGGYLADKKGRRIALSLNLLIYTLGGLISAVATNYEVLVASRLIVGIGLGGEFTIGIAMMSEMVATRYRGTLVGFPGHRLRRGRQLPVLRHVLGPPRPARRRLGRRPVLCGAGCSRLLALPAVLVVATAASCPNRPGSWSPRAGSPRPTGP